MSSGQTIGLAWIKRDSAWNTFQPENVPVIVTDISGNTYCAYSTYATVSGGTSAGQEDIVVLKIDSNGTVIWITQNPSVNTNQGESFPMIALDSNGNLYLTYITYGTISGGTSAGWTDIVVAKFDTDGNLIWTKQTPQFNTSSEDYRPSIAIGSSGDCFVTYRTYYGSVSGGMWIGAYDIVVLKFDTDGNLMWTKEDAVINTQQYEMMPVVGTDGSGNAYIAYQSDGVVSGGGGSYGRCAVVMKLDSDGNILWIRQQEIMTSHSDNIYSIAVDTAGNSHVAYTTYGTVSGGSNNGQMSVVIFKLDTNGNMVWIQQTPAYTYFTLPRLAVDASSNVYLTFYYGDAIQTSSDIAVYKYDSSGNQLLAYTDDLISTAAQDDNSSISADSVGNIYVAYTTSGEISTGAPSIGSNDVVIFKLTAGPNAPTITSTSLSNKDVTVICSPPTDNGGADITEYMLTSLPSGITANSATTTLVGNNMITGVPYTFRVRSKNANGVIGPNSAYSNTVVVVGAPENVSVGYSPEAGIRVSWNAGPITYKVYRDTQASGATKVLLTTTSNAYYDDTTYVVSTQYYYFVSLTVDGTEYISSYATFTPTVVFDWIKQDTAITITYNDMNYPKCVCDSDFFYVTYNTPAQITGAQSSGNQDICVAKMNYNGTFIWAKQLGAFNTSGYDEIPSIDVDSNGNVYIAYRTTGGTVSGGTSSGGSDIVVFKLDSKGDVVWVKQHMAMNTSSNEEQPFIKVDKQSGNVFVGYMTNGNVSGGQNVSYDWCFILTKLDSITGEIVWLKTSILLQPGYIGTGNMDMYLDNQSNIYVAYITNTSVSGGDFIGSYDLVVCKLNSNGDSVWIKQNSSFNTNDEQNLPKISGDNNGNIYITYTTNNSVSGGTFMGGSQDIVVLKLDMNGNTVWVKQTATMNTSDNDMYPSITTDPLGNTYIGYSTYGTISGGQTNSNSNIQPVLVKIDTNGNIEYALQQSIIQTPYNGIYYGNYHQKFIIAANSYGGLFLCYLTTGAVSGGSWNPNLKFAVAKYSGSAIAPTPRVPGGLALKASTYNAVNIDVSWAVTGYADYVNIYRDIQSSGATKILLGTSTGYTFTDPSVLTDGTTYYYFISSVFNNVETNLSEPVSITYYKPDLTVSWIKQTPSFNTNQYDMLVSSILDSEGNLYVSYTTPGTVSGGTASGNYDIVVFKLDSDGNVVWTKQMREMNTPSNDSNSKMAIDTNDNIYITYMTDGTVSGGVNSGSTDIVVAKLTKNGELVWVVQKANVSSYQESPNITTDASGNVYVCYYLQGGGTVSGGTNSGNYEIVIFKLDTNGNVVWTKQSDLFNTSGYEMFPFIVTDLLGNIYVSYLSTSPISGGEVVGSYDVVVFKMDINGNMVWIKQSPVWNTPSFDFTPIIALDSNNNIYVVYGTYGSISGSTMTSSNNDIVLFKLDNNGNTLYAIQNGTINTYGAKNNATVRIDSENNIYIAYSTYTQDNGDDIVLIKANANGIVQWTKQEGIANTTGFEGLGSISIDSNNNVYISGQTSDTVSGGISSGGGLDVFVVKYGSSVVQAPPSAPIAPYSLTGDQQLSINFTPGSNGRSQITNYKYSIDNGSTFTAFSPATGAVSSVTITGLTNGQTYNIQLKAVNAIGDSPASATVTGTPESANNAVASGPTGITNYILSQPVTNNAQKVHTIIGMRTSIKEATFGDNASKAASQVAYINTMSTQMGTSSCTLPSTDFTRFLNTFASSASGLTAKPVDVYFPTYASQIPIIDVSAVSSATYFHTEIPVSYSAILQNGAATLKLTNNGTAYVDDSSTVYNVNTSFVLGNKTYIILAIGSIMLDVQSNGGSVVCLNEGTHILTPNGNVPIETLRKGDMIVTGTRDVKPVVNIQKIVVVRASENNAPYIIEKEAFGTNCPPNRLIVSPRHAIQLQPGLWEIPREAAKENKRVYQNKEALDRKVIYYHITLPNYESDTLVANGQITEALNDGKVAESYVWNNDKRGYVREIKPIGKKATA